MNKINQHGRPKEPRVIGNENCWYGGLEFVTKDLIDPTKKLIQLWNLRKRKFGTQNVGKEVAQKAIFDWCRMVGVDEPTANNMWARKSLVTTGLNIQCFLKYIFITHTIKH